VDQVTWDALRRAFLHWHRERQSLDTLIMAHASPPEVTDLVEAVARQSAAQSEYEARLAACLESADATGE
jgi:hypothetical protein